MNGFNWQKCIAGNVDNEKLRIKKRKTLQFMFEQKTFSCEYSSKYSAFTILYD